MTPAFANDFRLCIIGSGGVGKSCITLRFLKNKFSDSYDPTIEEGYRKVMKIDEVDYNIEIIDTAGQDEFESFRDASMNSGDGFIMVYSIVSRKSFEELCLLYQKLVRMKNKIPDAFVVVGNKIDREQERQVSRAEVRDWCTNIRCRALESSAKTGDGISTIFETVVRNLIQSRIPVPQTVVDNKKKRRCVIL